MSEQPAATPAAGRASTAKPAAAAAPAAAATPVNKQPVLRAFIGRINSGEFDPGHKDFHQFVVKEIYPLLANGTLGMEDLEKIAKVYSARADPYNKAE